MSLSSRIREQLINSFRAELAEHVQTMMNGLLAIEQGRAPAAGGDGAPGSPSMDDTFRAAHSLKGAARAVGITVIEELAHSLESALDGLRKQTVQPSPELFNACYHTIDAIQAVQTAYEAGATTPPLQALQALAELGAFIAPPAAVETPRAVEIQPEISSPLAPLLAGQLESIPASPASDTQVIAPAKPANGGLVARKSPAALKDRVKEIFKDTQAEEAQVTEDTAAPAAADATRNSLPAAPAAEAPAAAARSRPTQDESGADMPSIPASKEPAFPPMVRPAVAAPLRAEQPANVPGGPSLDGDETIRVRVSKLDTLMAQMSELLVIKIRTEQRLAQVKDFQEFINQWQKDWQNVRNAYGHLMRQHADGRVGPVEAAYHGPATRGPGIGKEVLRMLEFAGNSQDRLRDAKSMLNLLAREYANDTTQMSLAIDELEQEVKRLRMLPLHTITTTFGRMVRDLAQKEGKDITLLIVGGETELDKHVLEQIKDPLIHLLRNAVDHGIERPAERIAHHKPRAGTITLKAEQIGKDVVIMVSDDGEGIDLEAVRRVAIRHNRSEAQTLSEEDLKEYLFRPGFSTSPIVTDISGRGVGLDVVRRNVEALHGRVDVSWKAGEGSTFTLAIPLRLTGSRGLLVRASGQTFAIPINAVEYILSVRPEEITPLEGHDTIRYNGRSMALTRLGDVLDLPRPTHLRLEGEIPVVILASSNRSFAFAVDELAGEQEIVIKGLGRQLLHIAGVTGATVMGNGEVVIILNVSDLIKLAMHGERQGVLDNLAHSAVQQTTHQQHRILIVDDSITTRTLEKNILEAAGYTVQIATDGQEALNAIAANGLPDLVVSDISMPRVNGFELARRIKDNPATALIPVILVSSLDSPEDKARGIEAGADAYITKGSFDQNKLLETIEQMILPLNA